MQKLKTVAYDKKWYEHTAMIVINNPKEMNSYLVSTLRRWSML